MRFNCDCLYSFVIVKNQDLVCESGAAPLLLKILNRPRPIPQHSLGTIFFSLQLCFVCERTPHCNCLYPFDKILSFNVAIICFLAKKKGKNLAQNLNEVFFRCWPLTKWS
jgi:hypothetical protein